MVTDRMSRREFVTRVGAGSLVLGGASLLAAAVRFLAPSVETAEPTRASGPLPSGLTAGQPAFLAANRTWLLRDGGGIYALAATCTHLGCTVRWEAGRFQCPCHGSEYDAAGARPARVQPAGAGTVWVGADAAGHLLVDGARRWRPRIGWWRRESREGPDSPGIRSRRAPSVRRQPRRHCASTARALTSAPWEQPDGLSTSA